jgi:hypothetical protein
MTKTCFQGDAVFERARQNAFEAFLNRQEETKDQSQGKISTSEVLAVYTDIIMRKGGMKSMQELG